MNEKKEDQLERALLSEIPPDKREDFKKLYRFVQYKGSGLFYFLWNFALFLISIPLVFLERLILSPFLNLDQFLVEKHLISLLIFAFFHMVILSFFTKNIRAKLNQKGVWSVHIAVFGLILIYGMIAFSFYVKFQ